MFSTVAALAFAWALMGPGTTDPSLATGPVAYEDAIAAEAEALAVAEAEAVEFAGEEADWRLSARLYHAGGGGATGNDSLGCRPIAMRTVAVDPRVIPRRTKLFIRETVGMRLADGSIHDGYWYASDTGGAIKGQKIDLYTGNGRGSMNQAQRLNMRTLTIVDAGDFDGCPPAWTTASN